jgi:hypothetical protein
VEIPVERMVVDDREINRLRAENNDLINELRDLRNRF